MRGGDHPRAAQAGAVLADALEAAVLQDPQQLDLQRQRQVADLVEEERALGGDLEAAEPVAHRAGEGAARVAEHLALEQLAGQRAAVDRHERTVAARRALVERARDHLLADPALAGQQHRGVALAEVLDQREDPLHRGGAGDDAAEGRGTGGRRGGSLLRRPQDHGVGDARVAGGLGRRADRRRRHGEETRLAVDPAQHRAPPLAPLAGLERGAQGAAGGEEPAGDELVDRPVGGGGGGPAPEQIVEDVGGVDNPEAPVQADGRRGRTRRTRRTRRSRRLLGGEVRFPISVSVIGGLLGGQQPSFFFLPGAAPAGAAAGRLRAPAGPPTSRRRDGGAPPARAAAARGPPPK